MVISRRKLAVLTVTLAALFSLSGCVVESVYPWYEEGDVVFEGNLAGTWVGEKELNSCLLNIVADSTRQVRHYNIEFSKLPGGCPDLNSDCAKQSGGGQVLHLGRQRFFDNLGRRPRPAQPLQDSERLEDTFPCAD